MRTGGRRPESPAARKDHRTGVFTDPDRYADAFPEDLGDFDPRWVEVQRKIRDRFGKKPDLQALLFLIGLQELGQVRDRFTKEEKQDLMHVAVCRLLAGDGFYRFAGRDEDGWPHWEATDELPALTLEEQERLLRARIIRYFADF